MIPQAQERLSKIKELAEKAAYELGLILLGVRMKQQGKNQNLEISIYRKDPPINFSDCEQMSRSLAHLLEVEETKDSAIINGPYLLEVLSAGIDRQLDNAFEFNLFAGSKVRVNAKEKIHSLGTEFIGTLLGGDERSVTLNHTVSFSNKLLNGQTKVNNKSQSFKGLEPKNDAVLTIDLQQIYRINLFPDIKEISKNAAQ